MIKSIAIAGIVLVLATTQKTYGQMRDDKTLFKKNNIVINERVDRIELPNGDKVAAPHNFFLYDRIAYGIQYQKPAKRQDFGKPDRDFSRLATTYYHRHSPVGIALEKFNWFPGPFNTYWADARLPASLVAASAQQAAPFGLAALWSEPPVCMVGLHMGTVASYARPTQHWRFFEHNPELIRLCQPAAKDTRYFHFVEDAQKQGAQVKIDEGKSRSLMAKLPDGFFHLLIVEAVEGNNDQKLREGLLTREGMKLCMDKLVSGGVLCYHTSNRYYLLAEQVSSTADSLEFVSIVGHDMHRREGSAFTSEWVMVARKPEELKHLTTPPDHAKRAEKDRLVGEYWQVMRTRKDFVWWDGKVNYKGMYRADPYLIRPLRELFFASLSYLPTSFGHPDSLYFKIVDGALDALENLRLSQLNGGR